jgi:hypothetical protein
MNQHYVPRTYLKNFAVKGKKNEYYANVYDIQSEHFIRPNIKGICAEKDFYTLDNEVVKDRLVIEKAYSEHIEPMYGKAYDLLTNDKILHVNSRERTEILVGIIQLYARNPSLLLKQQSSHRDELLKLITKNKLSGVKGVTYLGEDYSFRDCKEEIIIHGVERSVAKQFKLEHLKGTEEILKFHGQAKFEVFKIDDESRFMTCDNPIILSDSLTENEHPLLRSKQFTLTLNNKYALNILHDNRKDGKRIYKCNVGGGNTWSINKGVIENCSRFLLTDEEGLKNQRRIDNQLNDTDPEKMINIMRQMADKLMDQESEKVREVIKEFLDKHDQGLTTKEDEQRIFRRVMEMGKDLVRERIIDEPRKS